MVQVMRIDKCIRCNKEYIINIKYVEENKLPIEFNVIYCYKCVKKELKENEKNK